MASGGFQISDAAKIGVGNRLFPSQSRSTWPRYVIETMMNLDALLDGLYNAYQFYKRQGLIEEAVCTKAQSDPEDIEDKGHEVGMDALLGQTMRKSLRNTASRCRRKK